MNKNPFLELQLLKKSFGDKTILHDISVKVFEGEFISVLGASGCGKSTLLHCIAGLEPTDSGKVLLEGQDISNHPPRERDIGIIFQNYNLFPNMTVYENIKFGPKINHLMNENTKAYIDELLNILQLTEHIEKYPHQLSGGQQQRVAVARSLVLKPKLMLFDEPFSSVDAQLRKQLQRTIKEIHNHYEMTSIFVTHDLEEASLLSDRIVFMDAGYINQIGTSREIFDNPSNRKTAEFIGKFNIIEGSDWEKISGFKSDADTYLLDPYKFVDEPNLEKNEYIHLPVKFKDTYDYGWYQMTMYESQGLLIKKITLIDKNDLSSGRVTDNLYFPLKDVVKIKN